MTRLERLPLVLCVLALAASGAPAEVLTTVDGLAHEVKVLRVTAAEGVVVRATTGEKTYPFDDLEAKCACEYLKRTVRPDDAEGHIRLGKYCLKRKRTEEAKTALLQAKKLDPKLSGEVDKIWAEANAERPRPELTPEQVEKVVAEQRTRGERVQDAVGVKTYTLETDHFIIHTTFIKADHKAIMRRCEQLYEHFDEVFRISKNSDRMWDGKCVFYCFKERSEFIAFSTTVHGFAGQLAGGYFRAQGGQCEVVIPNLHGAERFEETMVHEGAHAFLHFYRDPGHIPTWVHEGVAQYFQFEMSPESTMLRMMRRIVREGAKTGGILPLVTLANSRRPSGGGDHVGYAYAWGYIRYMIERDPRKFTAFIRGLKGGLDAEDALKQAYDWDFDEMQKRWNRAAGRL
ncbi:MAG TPA: DUF1570 domain-containing protein [Planctomycetota bacterium]|nr:DUF1570 domain-containing protein [Planctomycetota bacterium]